MSDPSSSAPPPRATRTNGANRAENTPSPSPVIAPTKNTVRITRPAPTKRSPSVHSRQTATKEATAPPVSLEEFQSERPGADGAEMRDTSAAAIRYEAA